MRSVVFGPWRHALLINSSDARDRGAAGAGQGEEGGFDVSHHPQALGSAYMADGVHPEALGHALWADIIIYTFRRVRATQQRR